MNKDRPSSDETEVKWTTFVKIAFNAVGLPDVPSDILETGTYTNMQIAERFRTQPAQLLDLLQQLPKNNPAVSRGILSFRVDMIDEQRKTQKPPLQ